MTFTKTGLLKCKKRDCLNYNTYDVCGHTLEESACTSSLTLFLQSLQKNRNGVNLLELSNFVTHAQNPCHSGPKRSYKRVGSKNISDKRTNRTKSTKQSIISSISSTELQSWKG